MAQNDSSSDEHSVLSAIRDAETAKGPTERLEAAQKLRNLSSENIPIEHIINFDTLLILVDFLRRDTEPDLQFESAWILTNVTAGTSEQVEAVINAGALPQLSRLLLDSRSHDVRHQALWTIGNIVIDNVENRDKVIDLGVLPFIDSFVTPEMPLQSARTLSWFIHNLCSYVESQIPRESIIQILPTVRVLISHQDSEVLTQIAWAVAFLARSAISILQLLVDSGIVTGMAQLLRHENTDVLEAVLNAFTELTAGTDEQVQVILGSGFLNNFPKSLGNFEAEANEGMIWILANIAGGPPDHIQAMINNGFIRPIIMYLNKGWSTVQGEAFRAVFNIVGRGTTDQVMNLAKEGVIPPLIRLLKSEVSPTDRLLEVTYVLNRILSSGGTLFVDLDA